MNYLHIRPAYVADIRDIRLRLPLQVEFELRGCRGRLRTDGGWENSGWRDPVPRVVI